MREIDRDPPSVSVVVPVYNNRERLHRALDQLMQQEYPGTVELIVVDNGSTDGTVESLASLPVKVIIEPSVKSPYVCRNTGIRESIGDVVVLLDSNCVPIGCDWVEKGVTAILLRNADIVAGEFIFVFRESTPSLSEYADSMLHANTETAVRNGSAPGGALFVRKDAFKRFGMFPSYLRSNGDTIWTGAVTKAGGKIVFVPEIKTQYPAKNSTALLRKQLRLGQGNRAVWLAHNHGRCTIIIRSIWNMRPHSISRLRDLQMRRGREHKAVHPFWKIYVYLSLLNVFRGLGRLGFTKVFSVTAD